MSKCAACPASAYCLVYGPRYMEKHHKVCGNCGHIFIYKREHGTGTFRRRFLPPGSLCEEILAHLPALNYGYDRYSSRRTKCAQCYLKNPKEEDPCI